MKLYTISAVLLASLLASSECLGNVNETYFDIIIFAQNWPTTNCIEWKEKKKTNKCTIPKGVWTVHGIWPSKYGEIGPSYCRKDARFDPEEVRPILSDLEAHWTNVHANTEKFSFWTHEWNKHGTCAMVLNPLDSEFKYFSQGIHWNIEFPLHTFLGDANIFPGNKYSYEEIYEAVKKGIGGFHPAIQCEFDDKKLKIHTLAQINICFDKGLALTNCDKIHGGLNIGCPEDGILYPSSARYRSKSRVIIAGSKYRSLGLSESGINGLYVVCIIFSLIFVAVISFLGYDYYVNRRRASSYESI